MWTNDLENSFNFLTLQSEIKSIALLDNEQLLVGSCDSQIHIYNISTNKEIKSIRTEQGCVSALTMININEFKYIVSASSKTIQIWNASDINFKSIRNVTNQADLITYLTYSYVSSLLASDNSNDNSIVIWNVANYKNSLNEFQDSYKKILGLAVLDNGNIVTASEDYSIKILNPITLKDIKNLVGFHTNLVNTIITLILSIL